MWWWFFSYALHLWPLRDTFLYFTASCAAPLAEFGCGFDAGLWSQGRVWEFWDGR